jgi:DNA-directed RNA polymerase specialized sigma24 family protein
MAYADQETFQLIDELLGKMSPTLRLALTMTYYDEVSSEEASALPAFQKELSKQESSGLGNIS